MRRAVAFLACASCALPALDLAGKGCPCASGYTCDEPSGRCIANGTSLPDATVPPDATVADANDAGDAPVDSPGDAPTDAGPDVGCPGHPAAIFCDNFDDGPLGARWSSKSVTNGTLTLSTAQAQSSPYSLLATVDPSDGGATGSSAALLLEVGSAFPHVRSTYDVYIDKVGARSAALGSVYVNNGVNHYGVYLIMRSDGGVAVQEDGILPDGGDLSPDYYLNPAIPRQSWTRVVLDVELGAKPNVTVMLEVPPFFAPSKPVLDHQAITPTVSGVTTTYYAGIEYDKSETLGWRFFIDNVVLEAPSP
jgi:hypothetical protein